MFGWLSIYKSHWLILQTRVQYTMNRTTITDHISYKRRFNLLSLIECKTTHINISLKIIYLY